MKQQRAEPELKDTGSAKKAAAGYDPAAAAHLPTTEGTPTGIIFRNGVPGKTQTQKIRKEGNTMKSKEVFNTSDLRNRILSQYGTIKGFAQRIGMKPEHLYNRLNHRAEFSYNEMNTIKCVLKLNSEEIVSLFFTPEDDTKQNKLLDLVAQMTDEEMNLFMEIMILCNGHPERKQFSLTFSGKLAELPEILAAM